MRTALIAVLLLLAAATARAQFNGCAPGFCSAGTGGGGGSGNFLLSETGSALLVDTGVKFLVQ
jgi:hypothetical protein